MKMLYFSEKTAAILRSDKRKQQLSAIQQVRTRMYSALKTEWFRMILLCDVVFKRVYMEETLNN